jgi:hypothetical protein
MPDPKELVARLEAAMNTASVEELIGMLYALAVQIGVDERLRRVLTRTVVLRLTVKVMDPAYLDGDLTAG